MSVLDFIILLILAGIIGSLGQAISGVSTGGCLVSIALGFIGALVGTWLARLLKLPDIFVINIGGANVPIVWSIIGATLFVAVIGFISRGRRRY
jgi:uncharacterized membrane protein YeaQ/YmgE (transglycosylase-associated protein family)